MGSNLNFKNFENNDPPGDGGGVGRPPTNFPLARQSSIYSLTFEEFQSTVGGSGKDFGSMNMDELLKNIWSAEENQNFAPNCGSVLGGVQEGGGYLQRQGSLTLPRTLSQKTVDEVWRDMSKDYGGGPTNPSGGIGGSSVPHRQKTFGEITLEEFLVKARVVREDAQLDDKANNAGYFGDLWHPVNNSALGFVYQQKQQIASRNGGLMGGGVLENGNQIAMQSANLPLNVNGVRQQQQQQMPHVQQHQQHQQHQQQILPKQPP